MSKLNKKHLCVDAEVRSVERQQGIAHLWASGPRVVMEAFIEVAAGKSLDEVLDRYRQIPIATYRALGAHVLPFINNLRLRGARCSARSDRRQEDRITMSLPQLALAAKSAAGKCEHRGQGTSHTIEVCVLS
jgi:hypothetical protein